jgi:transposase
MALGRPIMSRQLSDLLLGSPDGAESRDSSPLHTERLIEVLGELCRFLGGEKAALLWDGLSAHPSTAMRAWLNPQRSWLVVERLPAYAPELNPVEGLWSSLKAVELATSPARPWPRSSPRRTWGSTVSGGRRIWSIRSCGTPACRCRDTPQPGAPSRRSPRGLSWSRGDR